ncbi:electroneutral sodium bicarbonate exchanger 1-like isoform X2 [Tachypleus tridentatus]|uniref:electroneutral sodium bicarbonate exchanger 1-like isoform X2 n=1 Tax=Tachypleus tridentatus TaxID=6853 RepID=UPI003FD0E9A1
MESLLTGAVNGLLYGDHGSYYLPLCLWIGLWTSAILIALVAFDASALVCYVTWFTEENFATLISIIFIYKAVEKLLHMDNDDPIHINTICPVAHNCYCTLSESSDTIIQLHVFLQLNANSIIEQWKGVVV